MAFADSTVVFNEIMYHPSNNEASLEWVELHNQMAVDMDLSKWSLEGGVQFTFPEGSILAGGGYLVVAISPAALAAASGYTNAYGPFLGRLSNSGERLELRNNNHRLMDRIEYDTDGDWPVAPDGSGVSLAKLDPDSASSPAQNWAASAQTGGTPGAPNFPRPSVSPSYTAVVGLDHAWQFDDTGADLGTAWRESEFDDGSWPSGRAFFYAGTGEISGGEIRAITNLFSTGLDANGNPLPPGAADPHYWLTVSAQGAPPPPPVAATAIQNHPAWLANDALSGWLGPLNPGTENVASGEYRYRTMFDLTGYDPATAELTLNLAADNRLNNILINGLSTGISSAGFSSFSPPLSIRSGFLPGTNTLDFITANDGTTPNPAGFRVRLSGTARVPFRPTTQVHPGQVTTYFRATFLFNDDPASTSLKLHPLVDDGAVFYLNGIEVLRVNMPEGAVTASTFAIADMTNATFNGLFAISSSSLVTGTNVLAVEVHQAATGTNDLFFGAELLAAPAPTASPRLAFNEMAASTNSPFWIELTNDGTNDLSLRGYVLAQDGDLDLDYVFPFDQNLAAGSRLVVTESQLGFHPQSGDRLYLFPPNRRSVIDAVVVKPRLRGRHPEATGTWLYPARPTPGDPNVFSFHDEIVISEIMYHQRPVPPKPAVVQDAVFLPITSVWRYNQSGDLGTAWRLTNYNDSAWPSGAGLFYVEDAALPAPKSTPLTLGRTTYYFRTTFVVNGPIDTRELLIHPVIDDGAVFYLNGQEAYRINLTPGPVSYATTASPSIADATYTGPFILPISNLVSGTNLLAVEVHQASTNSTDIVFGTELIARIQVAPAEPWRESPESWIELYNRGTNAVDLTGWRLDKGLDFTFAPGTTMAPGSFLVVTRDTNYLQSRYPNIPIVGNFTNRLSHRDDLIVLRDADNNPADQVHYYDDGRWPNAADGGGSSLELRDPRADNSQPEAWAASLESARSQWQTYTYRGVASADGGPTRWNEFVLGLLRAGEVLLDDISVIELPDSAPRELIQNGTFETGASAWRIIGNHRRSKVIVDPEDPANHVLHLIATGPTEHMHNHAETTLAGGATIVNGREYQISFRARWLTGSNQLHTRLYFNRLARTTLLSVPGFNGTPGARNSCYESNVGPTFRGFHHTPVVPEANQPVTVSVVASDPDGVGSAILWWSANGGAWTSSPMTPTVGGGFEGTIPGRGASTVVQFYVEAQDSLGVRSTFPARGRDARALYKVDDGQAIPGRLHNLRLLMTAPDATALHAATNVMSNEALGATVVYDEHEVFYDVGVHLQSSERGRADDSRVGFTIQFHPEHLFRGVHEVISVDRSGGYSGVGGDHDEIVLKHAINHAGGLPGMYDDLVRIIAPRTQHTGTGLLLMAKYGDEFLDTQYVNGSDGTAFKLELVYYPLTTADGNPQSAKLPQPDEVIGTDIQDRGSDQEAYRWFYLIENNRARDDYAPVIALARAFSLSGPALQAQAQQLMDVDEWMRVFAMKSLSGDVDTYGYGYPHNLIIYFRPEDQKALAALWDMDFSWTRPVSASLYGGANIDRLISLPANLRLFYGHLHDLITTTFNTAYMGRWTTHYGSLVGQNYSGVLNYIGQRGNFARSRLPAQVPFAITTNGGQDFMANSTSTVIAGTGWINLKSIKVENRPETIPFTWTGVTSWQASVPLILGMNRLNFLAYDFQGRLAASNHITVTSTAVGGGLDSDSDGIPDAWETANGLDRFFNNAAADEDGDGLSNRQEYLSGTDPLDPRSSLRIEASRTENGVRLSFQTVAGRSYTLESQTATQGGPWTRLIEFVPQSTSRTVQLTDPFPRDSGERFYRLATP